MWYLSHLKLIDETSVIAQLHLTVQKAYKKRFDIEEMFRNFKSGGYKLEDTNVSGNRLISLILIISLAYSMATF
jgi:hypothetical protein